MFQKEVYINRRKKLCDKVKSGLILIMGNADVPMNYTDNTYSFRQDSSFLYLFGLDYQQLAGVIDVDNGNEYIFGNDVDMDDIIWMGPQVSLQEKASEVGVSRTAPFNQLFTVIGDALAKGRTVHFLPQYRAENKIVMAELLKIPVAKLQESASLELIKAVISLRSVKEACEIEEIEKACAVGYEMHVTAMKMAQEGVWEQRIAGTIEGISVAGGGMPSFPVILSQNGETLHNHDHSKILQKGRLMLVDAGAETALHYASDFTRISPVGGEFTQKQREIYEIVLAANNRTAELAAPGVTYLSVHLAASEVIASGLKELGLMKGDVKEAVRNGAHALFFPHGIGHMLGLDVHDMENLGQDYVGYDNEIRPVDQFGTAYLRIGRRLQPGFVITDEPGIYFIPALIDQWKANKTNADFINFDKLQEYRDFGGIRLEDNLLVTETGARILGKRVPITPDEVGETMKH